MLKIEKISFIEHEIFGNKEFDFKGNNNTIPDTIILAGPNGVGKTKLLEEINELLTKPLIVNEYESGIKTIITIVFDEKKYYYLNKKKKVFIDTLDIYKVKQRDFLGKEKLYYTYSHPEISNIVLYDIDTAERIKIMNIGCLLSGVDINYQPNNTIRGVTNRIIDDENDKDTSDLAYDVMQLLIDIANQDSNDLQLWVDEHRNEAPPDFILYKRMKRFTTAFYKIFHGSLKYKRIENNIMPIFEKNKKEIKITDLSSGEKQIIFRGIYLLKNINIKRDIPILIDEPEISMHPEWACNIYDYYRRLFNDGKSNKPLHQVFMSTHNEYVLESAIDDENAIVIKMNDSTNKKYAKFDNTILNNISLGELRYKIFDMPSIDFHIMLYSYIQNELSNTSTIKATDNWLLEHGAIEYLSTNPINGTEYRTFSTYIRNRIDHPGDSSIPSKSNLSRSIADMIKIINNNK